MTIKREDLEAARVDLSNVVEPGIASLPTPGEILLHEWLEPAGITPYRLAKELGVPPNRITGVVNGVRAITADTALRLARYFGTDAQSWVNLQSRYDLAATALDHGAEIEKTVRPLVAA